MLSAANRIVGEAIATRLTLLDHGFTVGHRMCQALATMEREWTQLARQIRAAIGEAVS